MTVCLTLHTHSLKMHKSTDGVRIEYVLCTPIFGEVRVKFGSCTGVRVRTGQIRTQYVASTYSRIRLIMAQGCHDEYSAMPL